MKSVELVLESVELVLKSGNIPFITRNRSIVGWYIILMWCAQIIYSMNFLFPKDSVKNAKVFNQQNQCIICVAYTTSWGCWKHVFGIPGARPMFLKAELHKESKNGFKTINYRPPSVMFFSKNYFRHQKSSKKLDDFTSN